MTISQICGYGMGAGLGLIIFYFPKLRTLEKEPNKAKFKDYKKMYTRFTIGTSMFSLCFLLLNFHVVTFDILPKLKPGFEPGTTERIQLLVLTLMCTVFPYWYYHRNVKKAQKVYQA